MPDRSKGNKQVEQNGKDVVHTYTETSSTALGQKKRTQRLAE